MFYEELFKAFNRERIEYVVVGGVALNLHGVPRATADLDVVVALSGRNLKKITGVLKALGFRPRVPVEIDEFTIENIKKWKREKNMKAFTFWSPTRQYSEIDVLIHNPIGFREIKSGRELVQAGSTKIPIASLDHLIKLKKISHREQDKYDIIALKKIKRLRGK